MKAVFVQRDAILRDSGLGPEVAPEAWRLAPATLEAVRSLATDDTLLFLYGRGARGEERTVEAGLSVLASQVEDAGGRVDGLIACAECDEEEGSERWTSAEAALWATAADFDLRLNECYLIADTLQDASSASAAGVRPILPLGGRSILSVIGRLPEHRDFPLAADLSMAVGYVGVEEDITRQLGHPREAIAAPPPEELPPARAELPAITIRSAQARGLQTQLSRSRTQLRDLGRWLTFFVLGALGLSLGIAYMLTHLYRVQPFPEFVYYLTLQFIPRPLRGGLFILLGVGVIYLAARSYYHTAGFSLRRWRPR